MTQAKSNRSPRAIIVRVSINEGETGLFYATSLDLRGLLVAEENLNDLDEAIPKAIAELYEAIGVSVIVSKVSTAEDDDRELHPWVAFPVEIAKEALQAGE